MLGQELPQGPVDDDQGDGEPARLIGVPLAPPSSTMPFAWELHSKDLLLPGQLD